MNMIERVQEAIWQIGAANDITQEDARHLARAAIEAMLEPTQGMEQAGFRVQQWEHGLIGAYQSMIRAALEES